MTLSFAVHDKAICSTARSRPSPRTAGYFVRNQFVPDQIQPASLDLRLGEVAYPVRASFLPGRTTVAQRIDGLKLHEISLSDAQFSKPAASTSCRCWKVSHCPTTFRLPLIRKARPGGSMFYARDRRRNAWVPSYRGRLPRSALCRVSPRTFPVLVREGSRLSQIRFRRGQALLDAESLRVLHARERLVDADIGVSHGVAVSVDLSGWGPADLSVMCQATHRTIDVERRGGYTVADYGAMHAWPG